MEGAPTILTFCKEVADGSAFETPYLRDDFDNVSCLVVSLLLDVFDWRLVVVLLRELLVLDRARTSVFLHSKACNFIA